MRKQIKAEVDRAADEADAHPLPGGADLLAHIYANDSLLGSPPMAPHYISDQEITMIDAINHGLREEMERNPKIVMWGEDIADPKGGVFGVTRGLTTAFSDRVTNSPLAEASIVGVAGGMAIAGYKPIVEIQFGDYIWPAFMQMRDEIATVRWRSYGAWSCPVVVRVAVGGYIKGGPWHSACIEAFFAHIPGWYVVFPSCAEDAKGLIKMAARANDPVLFLEHKGLYRRPQAKSQEPDAEYLVPFGRGRIRREGRDITVVTWGSTVYTALEAARQLESRGSFDRSDRSAVDRSARRRNRFTTAFGRRAESSLRTRIACSWASGQKSPLESRRIASAPWTRRSCASQLRIPLSLRRRISS